MPNPFQEILLPHMVQRNIVQETEMGRKQNKILQRSDGKPGTRQHILSRQDGISVNSVIGEVGMSET